ncbi:MAG: hypothetical protein KAI74_07705, partial [Kiritimatiellae bacterium]|nr:hypothetical protein [Kiritimatiellia bacterium]
MKYCAGLLLILCALSSALADTVYVSTTSGSDGPGTSWDNAFHTIQGGVDAANSNDVVLVTNGIYNVGSMATPSYSSLNRVVVTNDITVISVNGPEVTVVVGAEATAGGIGVDAVRGVYMSAGTFSGFTVSNGYSWNSGDAYYDMHGGGINLYGGSGVVSNCIIRDCSALGAGAVAYGEVYGTIIKDNTAQFYGGGVAYSTLYNCVISQNQAASQGGGCYQSILYSCTVSGNHADSQSGGVHEGAVYNSIIYNNTAPDDDNWYDSTPDINYSCLTPLPAAGSGNITNNPMLLTSKQIATNSP